jgi:2',3'-cyclic-nucleotide 2'-phosphodiesterase (5'-nucleotidase family)
MRFSILPRLYVGGGLPAPQDAGALVYNPIDRVSLGTNAPWLDRTPGHARLFFMSDVQGKLRRIAKIGMIAQQIRAASGIDLLASGGDNTEGGEDVSILFAVMGMFNEMKVDFSAIGNHEFDYHDRDYTGKGLAAFERLGAHRKLEIQQQALGKPESVVAQGMAAAQFPFMCNNLLYKQGSAFDALWREQRIIPGAMTEIDGNLYLLLSSTTTDLRHELGYHQQRGFDASVSVHPDDPKDILFRQLMAAAASVDRPFTTILYSHCGLPEDERIAMPGIDLIIGAHTHNHAYGTVTHPDGSRTHIVHAGQNGLTAGLVDVKPAEDGTIESIVYRMIDVERSSVGSSSVYLDIARSAELDSPKIGYCEEPLQMEGKSTRSTPLMNFITDAARQATGADISINFGGNVREGFSQGDVTESELQEAVPFDNPLVRCRVSGATIRSVLEYALAASRNGSGKKSLLLHCSGLEYAVDAQGNLGEMYCDGQRVGDVQEYVLSVPDFMMSGLGESFPLSSVQYEQAGMSIRDALRMAFGQRLVVDDRQRITIDPQAPVMYNNPVIVY